MGLRRTGLVLLTVVVVLGMSLSGPAVAQAEPEDPEWTRYEESFDLQVTQVLLPLLRAGYGSNCLHEDSDDVASWRNVTITASWDALAPNTEELLLEAWVSTDADFERHGHDEGASPLQMDFETVQLEPEDRLLVPVQLPRDAVGVSVLQDVTVTVALEYQGAQPVFDRGGCAIA